MALFSWFVGNRKVKNVAHKNSQLDVTEASFNLCTMWPTAKVRRNTLVKQQEFTNSMQEKNSLSKPPLLKEKQS